MKWIQILWVVEVTPAPRPPTPSFSYGNPSSSSEPLDSSINQHLYEIPVGAKGQRRKLAAVFSFAFMLAAGLIAKCTISLISTLKQTLRQAGEELFAHSYILWHWILFCERGGGEWWVCEEGYYMCPPLAFSHPCLSAVHSSIILRCGRANSGAFNSFCLHIQLQKHRKYILIDEVRSHF